MSKSKHTLTGLQFSVMYAWLRKENVDDYEYSSVVDVALESKPDELNLNILNYGVDIVGVPEDFYNGFAGNAQSSDLSGSWVGRYLSSDESRHGWTALCLSVADQTVTGAGRDSKGAFKMTGHVSSSSELPRAQHVSLKKEYTMPGYRAVWRYDGDIATDANGTIIAIDGHWGNYSEASTDVVLVPLGSFGFQRADSPPEARYPLHHDRWLMLKLHVHRLARDRWSWSYFKQRRDDRLAAIDAYVRIFSAKEPQRYPISWKSEGEDPWSVLGRLKPRMGRQDAAFCRWLAERRLKHQFVHTYAIRFPYPAIEHVR